MFLGEGLVELRPGGGGGEGGGARKELEVGVRCSGPGGLPVQGLEVRGSRHMWGLCVWSGCECWANRESEGVGGLSWARPSGTLDFILGCGLITSLCWKGLQAMSGAAFLPSLIPHPYPRWSRLAGCPSLSLPEPGPCPPTWSAHPFPGGEPH